MSSESLFCIDSGSLIWAAKEAYPFDVAPMFWDNLEKAIAAKKIVSSVAQFDEIEKGDDELFAWVKARSGLFLPIDQETANQLPIIMGKCPKMVNPIQKKDEGDPYLVAMAITKKAIVVTEETPNNNDNQRIKIPDACRIMGISCIKGIELVRRLKLLTG